METEVEIKATAINSTTCSGVAPHHLPTICSDIDAVEIHDGEWCNHGSTRKWTYDFGVMSEAFKEKIGFDDENMKVHTSGRMETCLSTTRSSRVALRAIPKAGDGEGAIVKVVIKYEKMNKDMPYPENYLELLVK